MDDERGNHKTETIKKLKELAEGIDICMFCTQLETLPITARPMSANEVDDEGNIWFISNARSNKNFEIKKDDKVQLFFSKISDSQYLSVFGTASIYTNQQIIDEHWEPIAKAWFEEGKEDPDVTVIKVVPSYAYYWDTKDGKAISFLKWATAAVTGAKIDDGGIEGQIKV